MKLSFLMIMGILLVTSAAEAGPLGDRISALLEQRKAPTTASSNSSENAISISYGSDSAQVFDLYLPTTVPAPNHALPIIMMVHGGAWRTGDKELSTVLTNKLNYWRNKGYIFASINYRLLPDADPYIQAQDVARAIAKMQSIAPAYDGDSNRIIVMSHSAGAQLVALISADPSIAAAQGARRWRGSVILDSAALDVASVMTSRHEAFYDQAFGTDPSYWAKASPIASVTADAIPMMLVCSLKRHDDSCAQSHAFADKLKSIGKDTPVLEQDLTHREVNDNLGLASEYTESVDAYIQAWLKP